METDHLSREDLVRTLDYLEQEVRRFRNLYYMEQKKLMQLGEILTPYVRQYLDADDD